MASSILEMRSSFAIHPARLRVDWSDADNPLYKQNGAGVFIPYSLNGGDLEEKKDNSNRWVTRWSGSRQPVNTIYRFEGWHLRSLSGEDGNPKRVDWFNQSYVYWIGSEGEVYESVVLASIPGVTVLNQPPFPRALVGLAGSVKEIEGNYYLDYVRVCPSNTTPTTKILFSKQDESLLSSDRFFPSSKNTGR